MGSPWKHKKDSMKEIQPERGKDGLKTEVDFKTFEVFGGQKSDTQYARANEGLQARDTTRYDHP